MHEIKFDGYRLQTHIRPRQVKLLTRSGLDWTARFGIILAGALADLPVEEAIIDGEVVAEGGGGAPDFSALQDALSTGRTAQLIFYAFDLLYLDGYDLRRALLIERKAALADIIGPPGVVRYSEHFEEDGPLLLRHACRIGLEGVVSKVRDSPYRSGRRVGTGFNNKVAADLFRRLDEMSIPKSPFAKKLAAEDARRVRFVRPELVAEVEFRAWTAEGLIRHASFRGLREDKRAEEVVLETNREGGAREQAV